MLLVYVMCVAIDVVRIVLFVFSKVMFLLVDVIVALFGIIASVLKML